LVLQFRWLAAAGAIISLALAATLVITVRANGSDVLATIALALAILAFVVQLIVFIVQTTAANQQMVQAQELHGQMTTVLSQIGERTQGIHEEVGRMSERMYDLVAPKTAAVASAAGRRATRLELLEARPRDFPPGSPPSVNSAILASLNTWPSEQEAPALINHLASLSEDQRQKFYSLLLDEAQYRGPDGSGAIGPGLPADVVSDDTWSDLVERFSSSADGPEFVGLSEQGREVGRLLVPSGEPPAYLAAAAPYREEYGALREEVGMRAADIQRGRREHVSETRSAQASRRRGGQAEG